MTSAPIRTCVGCGGKAAQAELVRVVAAGSRVVVDRARSGGRGAWLHAAAPCIERAVKRRAFGRALRVDGVQPDAAALRVELTGNPRKD
ncbi:YlxR family protein [Anaeromyxobacter oryzae]|uniref:DNA-binding protein n=1 Tax=Anaeromyxobacter oryzae TaxID=2918170 RepID=A0ABM7WRE2_9BACT|nr:YlxR family protein [Anaeromyxobacter oryzae]BDG02030.1 DNA-binding protein [Anaeromyxobacter oryzae]